MSNLTIEYFIKEFDDYIRKSKKFDKIHSYIEHKTLIEFPLSKIINSPYEDLYKKGKVGTNTFIREICNENLMGTRVGQIYGWINKFFYDKVNPKINEFNKFIDFLKELDDAKAKKLDYNAIKLILLNALEENNLYPIRTAIIQIMACYFSEYFFPIYQVNQLHSFIKELNINMPQLPDEFNKKYLLLNDLLLDWKNSDPIISSWTNIMVAHFLYFSLPLDDLQVLRQANIGIEWLEINEQFVVAIFVKLKEKLGFPKIINIRTSFPDCEVEDVNGQIKFIEFEFLSSGFLIHKALAKRCDYVVCWKHDQPNWKDLFPHIEVIELKQVLKKV